MADGIQVPGIQASFELDADTLRSSLDKIQDELQKTADRVKAAQKELAAGSITADAYAKAFAQAAREAAQLSKAAEDLTRKLNDQKQAMASAFSASGSSSAWGKIFQDAKDKMAGIREEEEKIVVTTQQLVSAAIDFGLKQAQSSEQAKQYIDSLAASYTSLDAAATTSAQTFQRTTAAATSTSNAFAMTQQQVRGLGMAMIQVGYMVDDIRYGFSAIVNNMGPFGTSIATAFGASTTAAMGFGAAVQILAVAGYEAYNHWDVLAEILGVASRATTTHTEELEKLAHTTHKTADEQARYNKLKKEERDYDKLIESRPKAEVEQHKAVEEAITEADPLKVQKGLREALIASGRAPKASEGEREQAGWDAYWELWKKRLNPFDKNPVEAGDEESFKAKRTLEIIKEREDKQLDEMVKGLMSDPKRLAQLKTVLRENPGANTGLLAAIERGEVEAQDKADKPHVKEAKDIIPGIDKQAAAILKDRLAKGEDQNTVMAQLGSAMRGDLTAAGMPAQHIESAVRGLSKEALASIGKGSVKDAAVAKRKDERDKKKAAADKAKGDRAEKAALAKFQRESLRKAKAAYPEASVVGKGFLKRQALKGRDRGKSRQELEGHFRQLLGTPKELGGKGLSRSEAIIGAKGLAAQSSQDFERDDARERERLATPEGREAYQRQQDARRNKAAADAEKAVPGVGDAAKDIVLRARASGKSEVQATKLAHDQVLQALRRSGMKGLEAMAASDVIAGNAGHDVQKEVVDRALGGVNPEGRKVDIFDAADMNARVQRQIGGADPHKEAKEQRDKMVNFLATIAQQKGQTLQVKIQ